jgi:hypothetical protein
VLGSQTGFEMQDYFKRIARYEFENPQVIGFESIMQKLSTKQLNMQKEQL